MILKHSYDQALFSLTPLCSETTGIKVNEKQRKKYIFKELANTCNPMCHVKRASKGTR